VTAAIHVRVAADQANLDKVQLVVNGVIGDPIYGPDSDLYERRVTCARAA